MKRSLAFDLRLALAEFALEARVDSSARCLGVFGPSGSGKTSLLEALAGWRAGARGRIEVDGRTLLDSARGIDLALHRRHVGYVPQDALLFPHWDVERNVRAHAGTARARERSAREEAEEFERAVEVLGIGHLLARLPATLSGGERQRVALARALVSRPALLLLDEPLGGVDARLRRRILPWLVRLRDAAPVGIVFVSHDPTEVQVLCDEVLVLERGAVVARGAPAPTLRRHFAREERFENVLEGRVVQIGSGTARVELDAAPGEHGSGRDGPRAGASIHVPRGAFEVGERVAFALGSDDVLLALGPLEGLSARNVLPGTVVAVEHGPAGARVDLALAPDGPGGSGGPGGPGGPHGPNGSVALSATLTEEAVAQLGVAPGRRLHAVFKSSSCHVLTTQERD